MTNDNTKFFKCLIQNSLKVMSKPNTNSKFQKLKLPQLHNQHSECLLPSADY